MTNKMSKTVIIGSIVCSLVLLGVLSTFAYIILSPTETKEDLGVETGALSLTFSDGNNGITQALEFGGSVEKTFSIKNTGTLDAVAMINFVDLVNTYIDGSLTYSLSFSKEQNGEYTDVITDENVPRSEVSNTLELANGLEIQAGKTMYYKLMIKLNYLDDVDQTPDLKAMFSSHFEVKEGNRILIKHLLSKANSISINDYNSGVKEEMYTFQHGATEQTEALTDYRYIGNIPNNYINFNDETWRIIGVFETEGENGEKEQRVKIIRDESIGGLAWNTTNINEWPSSSLFKILNTGDYYNKTGSYLSSGLTEISKTQIVPTKWFLGGQDSTFSGEKIYYFERGTTTCETTRNCSGQTRSISTIASIGLIYSSDYLYTFALGVDEKCYTNGFSCGTNTGGIASTSWLTKNFDEWTLLSASSKSYTVYYRTSNGQIYNTGIYEVTNTLNIRPTAYLHKNILLVDGNGTQDNPYKIK